MMRKFSQVMAVLAFCAQFCPCCHGWRPDGRLCLDCFAKKFALSVYGAPSDDVAYFSLQSLNDLEAALRDG